MQHKVVIGLLFLFFQDEWVKVSQQRGAWIGPMVRLLRCYTCEETATNLWWFGQHETHVHKQPRSAHWFQVVSQPHGGWVGMRWPAPSLTNTMTSPGGGWFASWANIPNSYYYCCPSISRIYNLDEVSNAIICIECIFIALSDKKLKFLSSKSFNWNWDHENIKLVFLLAKRAGGI